MPPVRLALAALLATSLLATAARAHESPAAEMVTAANRFLNTLDDDARAKAHFEWDSELRTYWHFVPDFAVKPDDQVKTKGKRYGLTIGEMSPQQRLFARTLLNSALSHTGQQQVATIQALEKVLYDIEKRDIRDPELYYVSIFGNPSTEKTWAWRFEGHHLSVNVTLVDGKKYSVTPSFFGTNPHVVKDGPLKGTKVLAAEEDLARELVQSLSAEQRAKAVIPGEAYADILTKENREADESLFQPAKGITFEELDEKQQAMLAKLVDAYVEKYRPEIVADVQTTESTAPAKGTRFAWMGDLKAGGHYYRVITGDWLFEYDCTQNDANHVHAVWRRFDGDFGEDLLAKHYEAAHSNGDEKSR